MYKIAYSKDIEHDLSKLQRKEVPKILDKIENLKENPYPPGATALQGGLKGLYRIRSGNYRIVYQVLEKKLLILIVRIAHRDKVYKKKS